MIDGLDRLTRMVEDNLESPEFLLGLIAHWPGLALLAKLDGRVLAASRKWEAMGVSKADLIRHGWKHFVHTDDQAATMGLVADLVSGQPVFNFRNRWVYNGRILSLAWTSTVGVGQESDITLMTAELVGAEPLASASS